MYSVYVGWTTRLADDTRHSIYVIEEVTVSSVLVVVVGGRAGGGVRVNSTYVK